VKWAFDAIRSFARENRAEFDTFVRKLIIKSEQPHLSSYSDELKKRLRSRGFPEKRFQTIEEDLRGWLNTLVSQRLTPSTGVKITEEEFYARHCQLHSLWNAKELPVYQPEMAWDNLDAIKLALQQNEIYILQLEYVDTDEEEKKHAVLHYLQASGIRAKWINAGDITPKELELYNHELITTWQHFFRKMCDGVTINHNDSQVAGRTLFRDLMVHHHRPIRDGWVYNYLAWGSYHILADDLHVGWHPDFRQLFP
jgi:hypothetical protein